MRRVDLDFDVTTGSRFHILETILVVLSKLAAVVVFAVLPNGASRFNNGNLRLSPALDRVLRWRLVTPDMHGFHHSDIPAEANGNFEFNLPWLDRLFGACRAQSGLGLENMTTGLDAFRNEAELRLHRMRVRSYRRGAGEHAIDRRPR